jgi:sulfotransferase
MSGPVGGIIDTVLTAMSDRNEYSVFITDEQRQRIVRGIFENYYGDEFKTKVIFDTNRLWCARLHQLNLLFPQSKVIACVRNVPWIFDSIEKLVRSNVFRPSSIFDYNFTGTVYSRADQLASGSGMVGFAHNALKQAFYSNEATNLMLLRYETLVSRPEEAIAAVYDFIDEDAYPHDFNNVSYEAEEFDHKAGTPGMHVVRKQIEECVRPSILPPDLFNRFESESFWLEPQQNLRNVRVV